jgi:glycosyltransferase involved in cell wall biosynthesis
MFDDEFDSSSAAYVVVDRTSVTSIRTTQIRDAGSIATNSQEVPAQAAVERLCGGKRLKGLVAEGSTELPLVTVITAVYNGQPYVAGCLESVLRQDYPNIEHIVMDGGSSDGTVNVLRQYDERIALWKSEPDRGLYDAWNKALLEARGEWICFLGADDEFFPGAVSAYMALAAKNPEAEYLNSLVRLVHSSGYERTFGRPWKWKEFSRWMRWSQAGSMHRRRLFDRLGAYDPTFGAVADYEFLLRAGHGLKAAYMPMETVMMRWGGVSDGLRACSDATRAKIITGGRNPLLAMMELLIAKARYYLRPLRRRYYLRPLRRFVERLVAI